MFQSACFMSLFMFLSKSVRFNKFAYPDMHIPEQIEFIELNTIIFIMDNSIETT
jgi:hypothetical protein